MIDSGSRRGESFSKESEFVPRYGLSLAAAIDPLLEESNRLVAIGSK